VLSSAFRAAVAISILIAVGAEYASGLTRPAFSAANFFSFFTIVCNLFGAFVLLAVAAGALRDPQRRDVVRGAAALALTVVGVVFSVLLAGVDSEIVPWVNVVVHYVSPVAIVADWCLDPPATRLGWHDAKWWFVLPIAYVAYTLIRGAISGWYPYPFLDAGAIGYLAVAGYLAGILAFTAAVAAVLLTLGNRLRRRLSPSG
jgi:hypothetical protein